MARMKSTGPPSSGFGEPGAAVVADPSWSVMMVQLFYSSESVSKSMRHSPAGIDHPTDPAAETGGPRGAGTSISRTSGGRISEGDPPQGVDAEEFMQARDGGLRAGNGRQETSLTAKPLQSPTPVA